VKVYRYMICGVVATSISGCDVCTACSVVCNSIVALARLSIRSLRMVQLDRNV